MPTALESKSTFFRQGGWMVIATVGSGVFLWAVHLFSKIIPPAEYGVMGTMFQLLNCMSIPAIGLQMVFAQQSAAVINEEQHRQLAAAARAVAKAVFVLWLAAVGVVAWRQEQLVVLWKMSNPLTLWMTLGCALVLLWQPILGGVAQGRQNFLWLGWASIAAGAGRFAGAGIIVMLLGGWAAGIVGAALLGVLASLAVLAWQGRDVFTGSATGFVWSAWLRRVLPLTLGFGAGQVLFSADQLFVQGSFSAAVTGPYTTAGTLARALVAFTGPLAAVMFSRVARSVATKETTTMLPLTLGCTALMAGGGALALSVLSPFIIKLGFNPRFVTIAPLVPWFAWAMVPLTLAFVLVNNLMARERFRVVPWLAAVAVGYVLTLWLRVPELAKLPDSLAAFRGVVQLLGGFNLLLLAVAAGFTWLPRSEQRTEPGQGQS